MLTPAVSFQEDGPGYQAGRTLSLRMFRVVNSDHMAYCAGHNRRLWTYFRYLSNQARVRLRYSSRMRGWPEPKKP